MIRISRRNDDVAIKNDIKFEESLAKSKQTKLVLSKKNEKRVLLSLVIMMSGLTLFEIGNLFFKANKFNRFTGNTKYFRIWLIIF